MAHNKTVTYSTALFAKEYRLPFFMQMLDIILKWSNIFRSHYILYTFPHKMKNTALDNYVNSSCGGIWMSVWTFIVFNLIDVEKFHQKQHCQRQAGPKDKVGPWASEQYVHPIDTEIFQCGIIVNLQNYLFATWQKKLIDQSPPHKHIIF